MSMRKPYLPRVAKPGLAPRVLDPLAEFLRSEANSGLVLLFATIAALVWANSPWASSYFSLWGTPIAVRIGAAQGHATLLQVINDGLMALFFLLAGLEIKRELLIGELSSARKAALPVIAALGGMLVPAALYLMLNQGATARGWGIPVATDIAFTLGAMLVLGTRVPYSLKVLLVAVAIVDDIGAVLIIAAFYSTGLYWPAVFGALAFFAALLLVNRLVIRSPLVYMALGLGLWVMVLQSGVHSTIAGVALAAVIPTRVLMNPLDFAGKARETADLFEKGSLGGLEIMTEERQVAVRDLERASQQVQMPLERVEDNLGPWVRYGIMPLFALANAGVQLSDGAQHALTSPIAGGVMLGLVLGKPLGITLFSLAAVRFGVAELPRRVGMRQIMGMGMLAGIGFTMSLFISQLAFHDEGSLRAAKLAVLVGSFVSGVSGYFVLRSQPRERVRRAGSYRQSDEASA